MLSEFDKRTKDIYIEQHKNYLIDRDLFNRFYNHAIDHRNYNVPKGFFKGKKVLDLGCGNSVYVEKALSNMGCDSITCLDLGEGWIKYLKEGLISENIDINKFEFVSGSVVNLPFDDNTFDFVGAFGVFMHLQTIEDVEKAVKEMTRVTKKKGTCYSYFGIGDGILNKYVNASLREAYQKENDFKEYIDNLNLDNVREEFRFILSKGLGKDDFINENLIENLINLITLDSLVYFQNILQVPSQLGLKVDNKWIENLLNSINAENIKLCPDDFYYERKDWRRFFTPFHVSRSDSQYSKLIFGSGHIKYTWIKR